MRSCPGKCSREVCAYELYKYKIQLHQPLLPTTSPASLAVRLRQTLLAQMRPRQPRSQRRDPTRAYLFMAIDSSLQASERNCASFSALEQTLNQQIAQLETQLNHHRDEVDDVDDEDEVRDDRDPTEDDEIAADIAGIVRNGAETRQRSRREPSKKRSSQASTGGGGLQSSSTCLARKRKKKKQALNE